MSKAGFLGRFQPFHKGHYKVVENHRGRFEEFSIVIGSPEKSRTEKNPLTFEERKSLIKACFSVPVEKVEDTEEERSDPESQANREWAQNIEEKAFDTIITGNDTVKEIIKKNTNINVERPEMQEKNIYSGTEVRRRIRSEEEWRYLTPECSHEKLEALLEKIKESGPQYNFEPGWKKENAYHGTAD